MVSLDKLKVEFAACRGDFPWRKCRALLLQLGYEELPHGHTGGSRAKYHNAAVRDLIMVDVPHNGTMGRSMVRRIQDQLSAKGLI